MCEEQGQVRRRVRVLDVAVAGLFVGNLAWMVPALAHAFEGEARNAIYLLSPLYSTFGCVTGVLGYLWWRYARPRRGRFGAVVAGVAWFAFGCVLACFAWSAIVSWMLRDWSF